MKNNKKFRIVDMNGRKYRKEISSLGNLVGGFVSVLYALSIVSLGLSMMTDSLISSKNIDTHLESGTRVCAREVTRGKK